MGMGAGVASINNTSFTLGGAGKARRRPINSSPIITGLKGILDDDYVHCRNKEGGSLRTYTIYFCLLGERRRDSHFFGVFRIRAHLGCYNDSSRVATTREQKTHQYHYMYRQRKSLGTERRRFHRWGLRRAPCSFAFNGGGTSSCDNVNSACLGFWICWVASCCSWYDPVNSTVAC